MNLREFTPTDWFAFGGCEGHPLINDSGDATVVIDDSGLTVIRPPEGEDSPMGHHATLECTPALARLIVSTWETVPDDNALELLGFMLCEW